MYINKIIPLNLNDNFFDNKKKLTDISKSIIDGNLIIFKSLIKKKNIESFKKYLIQIGKNSFPEYQPIRIGTPNHHRIMNIDPRSFVKGAFHQFSFFRWNQDMFDVFELFKKGYWLKNVLSGNKKEDFLNLQNKNKNSDNVVARVSVQFYPAGIGFLNKHSDPVSFHQITAPLLIMSNKGLNEDFKSGGSYVCASETKKIYLEDHTSIGDLVMYNASIPHGVDLIDAQKKIPWFKFKGRWTAVLATNKVAGSNIIKDAIDLNKK